MDDICRLCCSSNFVNNNIFDEENALYLKMSLYLPIKVFKNDRLPQKICDKCSCKVNDFYQFCNETIEVQNRLRAVLISTAVEIEDSIDLTLIKQNHLSPPPNLTELGIEQKPEPNPEQKPEPFAESLPPTQSMYTVQSTQEHTQLPVTVPLGCDQRMEATADTARNTHQCDQSTQTDDLINDPNINEINIDVPLFQNVKIKEEPKHSVPSFKMEENFPTDNYYCTFMSDDDAHEDNISLVNFQKKKRSKRATNGDVDTKRKKKPKLKEWEYLMRSLPEGTALTVVDKGPELKVDVKQELLGPLELADLPKKVKTEPMEFHCCICFVQCYSRSEMLQHYKEHAAGAEQAAQPPPAPPPPDNSPLKCMRCMKTLEARTWAAHWVKHWERDRRPYRCALCEKTFRDHHQILKHGLTHKWGEDGADALTPPDKRFVCDLCPEGFHYMRYLLSHRTRAHPEAASRALALRCAVCARTFAHLNSLRRHLRAHSGERNFLCNICGKALSSREHLKFHIRIHTGYKPNVCKTCGKGFVKKCNLTLHERVHSGEKPHVCSHCGKAFSQRSTLVIHERYHSGARPYACALCGRGFVAKGLLSMHLKTTCI